MTKASFLRSLAVCALAAPALHAQTAAPVRLPTKLSLYGPREDLPWHRHDALWNLTG